MRPFRTHTGELVTGDRLQAAFDTVANDWANLARAIRAEDHYAPHVSEETKEANLSRGLAEAERVRAGKIENFTIWQRVNTVLTGECIALLA